MKRKRGYLTYSIPGSWCVEDNDVLTLFDPKGSGALTVSFYNTAEEKGSLERHLIAMAQKYIGSNNIKLNSPMTTEGSADTKLELSGSGFEPDGWFVKFWVIGKYPRILLSTYHNQDGPEELEKYEKVVRSFSIRDT